MRIPDVLASRKPETSKNNTLSSNNIFFTRALLSAETHMQEKMVDEYALEIDELRKEIGIAGDKLEKEPTVPNFKQFREVLSRLAKRINIEVYRLEKYNGTPQNPRYYEIITTINTEAENLYKLIIQEQKNNMAITAKVIGIKGLVVDLIS